MISTFDTRGKTLIAASVIAAIAFYLLRSADPMPVALIILKGTGVGMLALLSLLYGPGRNGAMLAGVMALGALGDMLIEFDTVAGAAAFLIGHLLAVVLYLRFRRERLTTSQMMLALVILVTVPFAGWSLPADRASAPMVLVYALALGLMAAAAWTSRFSRYSVGIGAVLFVLSDLLIFAEGGPLADSALPHLLIWPLYYIGQLMICLGVLGVLRREPIR
ncbi:lysoplasmalogenase family protein [Novosphingobium sp.]|uniref:lysoplasmalogenase family protein n=1 Tax=Novosphingobium sp. TaxID=1874826 RepID=UPI00286E3DFE|nr:lysoplasmalogenase family protein [Novosphingobium sp.]